MMMMITRTMEPDQWEHLNRPVWAHVDQLGVVQGLDLTQNKRNDVILFVKDVVKAYLSVGLPVCL